MQDKVLELIQDLEEKLIVLKENEEYFSEYQFGYLTAKEDIYEEIIEVLESLIDV